MGLKKKRVGLPYYSSESGETLNTLSGKKIKLEGEPQERGG